MLAGPRYIDVTTADGTFEDVGIPGIWTSKDGLRWRAAEIEPPDPVTEYTSLELVDITIGGPGLVAVGFDREYERAVVYTSVDGDEWRRVHDAGFAPGRMLMVGATDQGLVAFGDEYPRSRKVIWTSTDGSKWLRATNKSGLEVANGVTELVADGGRLTAFVAPRRRPGGPRPSVEVWQTAGRAVWKKVATLPGSKGASIRYAAHGPLGWLALDEAKAWTSPDGMVWRRSPMAPDIANGTGQLIADPAGFLVVETVYTEIECTPPPGDTGSVAIGGLTWTSSDGRTWQQMPARRDFVEQGINVAFVRNRTLIGIGPSHRGGVPQRAWTTRLPTTQADAWPMPSDRPAPRAEDC